MPYTTSGDGARTTTRLPRRRRVRAFPDHGAGLERVRMGDARCVPVTRNGIGRSCSTATAASEHALDDAGGALLRLSQMAAGTRRPVSRRLRSTAARARRWAWQRSLPALSPSSARRARRALAGAACAELPGGAGAVPASDEVMRGRCWGRRGPGDGLPPQRVVSSTARDTLRATRSASGTWVEADYARPPAALRRRPAAIRTRSRAAAH